MIQSPAFLSRYLQLATFLALLAFPIAGLAQDLPEGHPPIAHERTSDAQGPNGKSADSIDAEAKAAAPLLPPTSITHHTIKVAGVPLDYTAEAGTHSPPRRRRQERGEHLLCGLYARAEERQAPHHVRVQRRTGRRRGLSASRRHRPARGRGRRQGRAARPAAPSLTDNPSTWLDMTDLVFVDPVGTGYSRAGEAKDEEKFWGVEQDTDALTNFVRLYLIKSARMLSPVFLMGESYGGFRAGSLARALQKSGANSPSGIILISPVLEFSLLYGEDYDPLSWALGLPSLAAVNLESKGVTTRAALASGLKEAETYALSDYLVELASGAEAGGKAASGTVSRLTGLPLEIVERRQARISPSFFIKEFDRTNSQVLSRYDGSVSAPDPNPTSSWANGPDPVLDATVPLWTAAFVQYAGSELGYKTDATYRLLNRDARTKWDFGTSPTRQGYAGVIDEVQEARSANPSLEVLIATGYTDLITPYLASSFLVSQLPSLPRGSPIKVETYAGGHMLYLRPDSREALKQDAKGMYERVMKAAS